MPENIIIYAEYRFNNFLIYLSWLPVTHAMLLAYFISCPICYVTSAIKVLYCLFLIFRLLSISYVCYDISSASFRVITLSAGMDIL